MSSIREFTSKTLIPLLVEDARRHCIFNEADLQQRTAYHLYDRYIRKCANVRLLNQPYLRIGMGRGSVDAKPDIVLTDDDGHPFCAFELKCFLERRAISSIAKHVWGDISQLQRFKRKYGSTEYVFALVMVNLPDVNEFKLLRRELYRDKEPWMSHCLRLHMVNLYCDQNLRKRVRYDEWAARWSLLRSV